MRRRYVIVLTGIVLSLALFTGCGNRRTAEREAELQEEISELRQGIDDLRAGQDSQGAGAQSQASGNADDSQTSDNTGSNQAVDNSQGNSAQNAQSGNGGNSGRGGTADVAISLEEARDIALARVEGATASNISIELDRDDGWYVYEGEIFYNGMEYEFEIDADSGNILKWEEDRW